MQTNTAERPIIDVTTAEGFQKPSGVSISHCVTMLIGKPMSLTAGMTKELNGISGATPKAIKNTDIKTMGASMDIGGSFIGKLKDDFADFCRKTECNSLIAIATLNKHPKKAIAVKNVACALIVA
jgi:hypothetical protein